MNKFYIQMKGIKSKKMGESRRSETDSETETEIEEEFYTVMESIKSEEKKTINIKSTILTENNKGRRSEKSSDHFEIVSDRFCRLCAIQNNDMIDIFSPQGTEENIVEKIEHSLHIVVTETDTLPKQVCRCCLANLELCYQFHKTVAKAEKQLIALGKQTSDRLEETERNDEIFSPCDTQREDDSIEHSSDVETSSGKSIDILEEVQTPSRTKKENVRLPSVKPCSAVLFNTIRIVGENNLAAESRQRSLIDTMNRDTDSSVIEFNSERCSASNIQRQNTSDPGMPRETCDWSTAHKNKFSCSDCLKRYTSLEELAVHMEIHVGQELYRCTLCMKTFTTRKILRAHNRIHVEELAFSCNYCNKKFSGRRDRDDHQRIHTGERPYKCSDCGMTFAWRRSMIRHAVVHSNVRNYKCPLCDRTFKHSNTRNYHLATHTKNPETR